MKSLGIQMGEFKESIGAIIAPLAMKLIPALQKFGDWAQKHKTTIVVIAGVIAGIATAVLLVNGAMAAWNALQAVTAAVNAVTAASFSALWVATGAIVILAVIAALVALQMKFDIFGKAVDGIKAGFDIMWGAVKWVFDWIKEHWELLLAVLTGPFGLAALVVIKFKDDIIGFFAAIISWVTDNWKLILAVITGPFGLAFSAILFFKDSVIGVFNGLKDLAGKIFDGVGGAFKGVINAVISNLERGLNFAIKGLNIILDGIDSAAGPWINFGSVPEVSLPRLASGGVVMSPTVALIGESGPEAVIPLNRAGGMGMGTTVNVTVTSADPNAVVAALQKWVRQNGALAVTTNSAVRF
jgi:phage-related protein